MVEHKPTYKMRRHSFQSGDNRADGIWGAPASPNFDRNKNKVFPLKRPSHKPTFQKGRCSFQSSDNRGVGKALAPPDFGIKGNKTSSLKRPKTKGPPSTLADKDISKEESEDRINSILISATIILNIILLSFFTKLILVLPTNPDLVIFTQSSGINKNN